MLDLQQLPPSVRKQIDRIIMALEIMDQTASEKTCYKKDRSQGMTIYKPIQKKLKPSFSIATCKDNQWVVHVDRYKKIEQFQDLILEIIQKMEPDFIKVATYKNDSPYNRSAGEVIYTIAMREGEEVPPAQNIYIDEHDDDPEILGFDEPANSGTDGMFSKKYEKMRDAMELGKISALKTEMNLQLQMMQKENEFGLFKIQSQNQVEHLRRDYEDAAKERDRLRKELDEQVQENRKLQAEVNRQEDQIASYEQELEKRDSSEEKTKRIMNFGGMVAGRALMAFAEKTPKVKRVLNGFLNDMEQTLEGDDEPPIQKGGGVALDGQDSHDKQPTDADSLPEIEKFRKTYIEWVNTIQQKEALHILLLQAQYLSNERLTLQQVYEPIKPLIEEDQKMAAKATKSNNGAGEETA